MRTIRWMAGALAMVAVAAMALGVGVASSHSRGRVAAARRADKRRTLAQNRAAARADAKALLGDVRLPAGALRQPSGSKQTAPFIPDSASVVDQSRWQIPGDTPAQVMAYVRAHRPRGASSNYSTGSSSGPSGSSVSTTFVFPPRPGILGQRQVAISASARSGGGSEVTVEAQSVWIVPRTAASLIPTATRAVSLVVTNPAGSTVQSATLTSASAVAATVSFFNGLEAGQPGVLLCPVSLTPGLTPPDTVTVTFTSADSTTLATAVWQEGYGGSSGGCDPIRLSVDAKDAGTLWGGAYARALNRLFGITLPAN